MKDYIEEKLGMDIEIEEADLKNKLPLLYTSLYEFKVARMQNVEWVIAVPKEKIHLSQLRKHHKQIEKFLKLHCAIYLNATSIYSKNTMISEGIPFIIENREIYLPFLGILLSTDTEREIKPVQRLSFLTQRIILTAIYEKWQGMNVTKAAECIGVTKMSVTRCFDEIEFFDIPLLELKGKSRVIQVPENRKEFWNQIKEIMRNPVISTFHISDDLKLPVKGGMSALAAYSMIADNEYPTYIISKKEINSLDIKSKQISSKIETRGCIVQEVGYVVTYNDGKAIDPLSLALSLSEEEINDERVEKSVREMLEEYVW